MREEIIRTYYCDEDRRMKAATLRVIRYSDGRTFNRIQYHNGHNAASLRSDLSQYERQLLKLE